MKNAKLISIITVLLFVIFSFTGCQPTEPTASYSSDEIPKYENSAYTVVNDNQPLFSEDEITKKSFENYSDLDKLGRCGVAFACIGTDIMPTEERDAIGQVKPSGWHTVKYDIVDGKYLYNRCHLVGFQLAGENANEKNLITGTRYFNVEGMLPFENMVADYVKETDNHVMYRVTPVYDGDDLVAKGVYMEAYSVEDKGDGVCFNVFVHNIQPGIVIDYATGASKPADKSGDASNAQNDVKYVLNTSSKKFHKPDCSGAQKMSENNKQETSAERDIIISQGYEPCGICNP